MQNVDPILDGPGPDRVFQQALVENRFQIQQCNECKKHYFYPRIICPNCGSDDTRWVEVSGKGVVYSTSTVRRKEKYGGDINVSMIELEEGPRMMSRVEGIASEEVTIDLPVTAKIIDHEDRKLVVFVPAGEKS